jgi:hypothetical protein
MSVFIHVFKFIIKLFFIWYLKFILAMKVIQYLINKKDLSLFSKILKIKYSQLKTLF